MSKVPAFLARLVVEKLDRPRTVMELAAMTELQPGRVIAAINEARAQGHDIRAVEDGVTRNIRPRARPEQEAWTTVYEKL